MRFKADVTPAILRKHFTYNPITGELLWKLPTSKMHKPKDVAGNLDKKGYHVVCIKGQTYFVHRVAWAMMEGKWPTKEIDHIDRNPANNSWDNLRQVTRSQQNQNKGTRASSVSGVTGVRYRANEKRWTARLHLQGKDKWLGSFKTKEAAIDARIKAEQLYYKEFAPTKESMYE